MDPVTAAAEKLLSTGKLHALFVPTEAELERFFEMEASIQTGSGMPLVNLSLQEAMRRRHHLVIVQREIIDRVPHHNMTMVDSEGTVVGFDVPDDLRHEVEGRDDLVWLSEDFVMDPSKGVGEVSIVLHPYPITIIGEDEGVRDAVLMFPAAPVDDLIRDTYGVPHTREFNSAIVSFD
ncbi:MAG: hypothetical protein MJZ38_03215 [archaeon]|nr:hypothetical protein [archaeon]